MLNYQLLLIFTIFLSITNFSYAQIYEMGETAEINDCNGIFVDPGGFSGDYPAAANFETLICSENTTPGLTHIRLDFTELELMIGDTIRFFDGVNSLAPAIVLPVDMHAPTPFSIQASALNVSGCVFMQFQSDDAGQASGWRSNINCQQPCQRIDSDLTNAQNPDEGDNVYYYCPGDTAHFTADVLFPENDLAYSQSVESSLFEWFINGQESSYTDQELALPIDASGIYNLSLRVYDIMGCRNLVVGEETVIAGVAPELTIDESLNEPVCPGDIIELFTYFDLNSPLPGVGVSLTDITSDVLRSELTLDPPLLLPDGTGGFYQSSINILTSPPGATVSNELKLDSIWFELEHSYGGDLDIEIICPNGQSAFIIDFPTTIGTTNFGEPYATAPVDQESFDLTPGLPYRYNVVDEGPLTFEEFSEIAPIYAYTTVPSTTTGNTFTYSDTYFPEDTYRSEEPFNSFNSCPIRGEWTIRIQDNLGLDNGSIFAWGLAFTGAMDSLIENTVSWEWEANPSITEFGENSIEVLVSADEPILSFSASDSYGCTSEIDYAINILPESDLQCQGFAPVEPELEVNPFPWPNPFTNDLRLQLRDDGPAQLQVLNINGQMVYEAITEGYHEINTSAWPAGVYWLQLVQLDGNQIYTKRVIKQ